MSNQNHSPRECISCHRTATPVRREPGEPNILAVCLELSWRGGGKSRLVRAKRIQICERCFASALVESAAGYTVEASLMFSGIRGSLQERYSALLREEQEPPCR